MTVFHLPFLGKDALEICSIRTKCLHTNKRRRILTTILSESNVEDDLADFSSDVHEEDSDYDDTEEQNSEVMCEKPTAKPNLPSSTLLQRITSSVDVI